MDEERQFNEYEDIQDPLPQAKPAETPVKTRSDRKQKPSMADLEVVKKTTIQLPDKYRRALEHRTVDVGSDAVMQMIVKALAKPLARELAFVEQSYAENNGIKLEN